MQNKNKPVTTLLREWYFSIPLSHVKTTRAEILDKCKIDRFKWSNWLNGTSTPNRYERKIINEVAMYEVFKTND